MNKVALIILDGFGIGKQDKNNAIYVADTPFFDKIWKSYPHTKLQASGLAVGLPKGQIGGSEVGHLTIGSGRVLYQDLVRINKAFDQPDNPEFGILNNKNFKEFVEKAKQNPAHLIGLLSPGGIHSHQEHLFKILRLMKKTNCKEPYLHLISDGRDTLPYSGIGYAKKLESLLKELHFGKIVGVTGRFYGMDRDKNWDRTQMLLDLICEGKAQKTAPNLVTAFEKNYQDNLTDELQLSTKILSTYKGVASHEPILFWNYRSDRMKQVVTKIHKAYPENNIFTLTQYDKSYNFPVFFEKQKLDKTLSEIISKKGIKQLKSAETDKIPHVTYFFNGGVEVTFPGEIHTFVASTKVTYDKSPKMRAHEIVNEVEKSFVKNPDLGFAVINFANADLVSHFGVFSASVEAVETVDRELARLCEFLTAKNFICLITADHGNADDMVDEATGQPRTAHSMNPVPFVIYDPNRIFLDDKNISLDQSERNGLSRIAPTVLEIMGMEKIKEYDKSLLKT